MTVFRAATLRTFFFAIHAEAKELMMAILKLGEFCYSMQCLLTAIKKQWLLVQQSNDVHVFVLVEAEVVQQQI